MSRVFVFDKAAIGAEGTGPDQAAVGAEATGPDNPLAPQAHPQPPVWHCQPHLVVKQLLQAKQ